MTNSIEYHVSIKWWNKLLLALRCYTLLHGLIGPRFDFSPTLPRFEERNWPRVTQRRESNELKVEKSANLSYVLLPQLSWPNLTCEVDREKFWKLWMKKGAKAFFQSTKKLQEIDRSVVRLSRSLIQLSYRLIIHRDSLLRFFL